MKRLSGLVCAIIAATLPVCAQRQLGELRIQVVDGTGAPIAASGELLNQSAQYRKEFTTGAEGQQVFPALPFGIYRLRVQREGFNTSDELLEIRSQVPLTRRVALGIAPIETTLEVSDAQTLLN